MNKCQLKRYSDYLNRVKNFKSKPIMRKIKIVGILKKLNDLVKHRELRELSTEK
jgi:hypothetical protein